MLPGTSGANRRRDYDGRADRLLWWRDLASLAGVGHAGPVRYAFEGELWRWEARRTELWTFLSVPEEESDEIHAIVEGATNGFGSVRVDVTIGRTRWRTSIFPGEKDGLYALPVKKAVRVAEGLDLGDLVRAEIALVDF